jgi:hypothetical protein
METIDEELQRSAREQGLVATRNEAGYWFLEMLDAYGTPDPRFVAAYLSQEEVHAYLNAHHEYHRELGSIEVQKKIRP